MNFHFLLIFYLIIIPQTLFIVKYVHIRSYSFAYSGFKCYNKSRHAFLYFLFIVCGVSHRQHGYNLHMQRDVQKHSENFRLSEDRKMLYFTDKTQGIDYAVNLQAAEVAEMK